ncbi:MAG: PAS domain S-box protein [Balneolales bacterium]
MSRKDDTSELQFLRNQQQVIASLAETFLRGHSVASLYTEIGRSISKVLQVDGCLLLECPTDGHGYRLRSACGLCKKKMLETVDWVDNRQLAESLKRDDVLVVTDYLASKKFHPPDRECFKNYRSGMSVRMPGQSGPIGVLAIYHSQARKYRVDEQEFLSTISNMLAGALSRDAKERALRETETRSKVILNTAVDAIITIDEDGLITLFNQAAQQMFGYMEEEVIGQKVNMLMPQPYRNEHDQYMENYKSTGKKKVIGIGREMTGERKDGSTFPLYLAVSEFKVGEKRHYTGIIRDVTEQRSLEQEVLRISDHERRRIGQDLHDGLGQMLTGIGLMSQGLVNKLKKENPGIAEQAKEITRLLREADEYAKNLSRGLLPVDFEVRGLVTSLERLATNAERLFGVECTFRESNIPVFYDTTVVEHLFRITQEAISNAVKHSQADRIRIELEANEEFAVLMVKNNGRGFTSEWQQKKGSGIDIMRFRAQLIGATLDIQNLEGGGVVLNCVLPRTEAMYRMEDEQE